MTEDEIIDEILRREGDAYTDHPADRGGPTKYGITQKAWDSYARAGDYQHVRDITEPHARRFYRRRYVEPFLGIRNDALRALVVDCGVNHGVTRATKWLQNGAGVVPDGVIGPITKQAVNLKPNRCYVHVLRQRLKLYADLAAVDPTQLRFLRGWIARACEFVR